jgi:multiple sugar transport system ATP-binding protein
MNFLRIEPIATEDGTVTARLPDGGVVPTGVPAGGFTAGPPVELGIRAEHCVPGPGVSALVDVVEHLGERTLVYARLGDGAPLVYQDAGDSPVRVGDTVSLSLRRSFVHLFDAGGRAHHAPRNGTDKRHG